ncbi:PASTA domain-containing protein [Polymorphospora lycopeni]|uniref:PASTA domain-containing protein n=1 Tax=Polymorphospora lycopeni TaxID=3140240 RepID=A0ABV5CJP3_9ACTN
MPGFRNPSWPARLRRRMPSARATLTGTRVNRMALGLVAVLAVTAVGFGTGYRSSEAALGDGSTYLQKGERVMRVNADNQDADAITAKKLATGKERLEIVQVDAGSVFVVNNDTGVVTRLPTRTLDPETVDNRPESKGHLSVVTGGGATYLVDGQRGTVDGLEATTGQRVPVPTPVRVTQAVVDSRGTAWGYAQESGELIEMPKGGIAHRQRVAGRGEPAMLTLVADAPVLYRPDSGEVGMYGGDGLLHKRDLAARHGRVSAPGARPLAIALPATGELVITDLDGERGEDRRVRLPDDRAGNRFGAPVVHHERIYVPDYSTRQVIVVEHRGLRVEAVVTVPGKSDEFQVTVRDNRVWINDPHDTSIVITFTADGRQTEIDVSTDPGDKPRGTPTVAPTSTPRQSPQPTTAPRRTPPAKPTITVPDLVGTDRTAACARLTPELRCVPVAQNDGAGETDQVLRTDPPAGSRVAHGSAVTVVYRGEATIPPVQGLPADQACRALAQAHLTCVEQPAGLAVDGNAIWLVTGQDPTAGQPANTGTRVTITYPVQIAVPNFASQPYNVACPVGLTCAPTPIGPGSPTYTVIDQHPLPGAGLDPNGTVTLRYHTNSAVPDVHNMPPDQACQVLQSAGLACNRVEGAATLAVNQVITQDPQPGTELAPGSPVNIVYESTGPTVLHRFKAPHPRQTNLLSISPDVPPGWSSQSSPGRVYQSTQVAEVPGLIQIYQFQCVSGCREPNYYLSADPNTPANYAPGGPAFSCFADQPHGTLPLHALHHPETGVWVWAREYTNEWTVFTARGFQPMARLCHIWP